MPQSARNSDMIQSEAYEQALKMAVEHGWKGVYFAMQEDGFDAKMDYVQLLELWRADSEGRL
jgi:hypothetical protein